MFCQPSNISHPLTEYGWGEEGGMVGVWGGVVGEVFANQSLLLWAANTLSFTPTKFNLGLVYHPMNSLQIMTT